MNETKVTTPDQISCSTSNPAMQVPISRISLDGTGRYTRLAELVDNKLRRQKPELSFTLPEIKALHDGYTHYGPAFMKYILPLYVEIREAHGFPVEYFSMVANYPALGTIGRRVIGGNYSNWAFHPPTEIMHDIPKGDLARIIARHLRFHESILDHNASIGFPMPVSEDGIAERLREAGDDIKAIAPDDSFLPESVLRSFKG